MATKGGHLLYKDIIQHLNDEIRALESQIYELSAKKQEREKALKAIKKLQVEEDRKAGKLAVQKGICPFPDSCNEREFCTNDRCSADVCSNGYAYRMS